MVKGSTLNRTHCGLMPVFKCAIEIEGTSLVLSKDTVRCISPCYTPYLLFLGFSKDAFVLFQSL